MSEMGKAMMGTG
ncbi:Protein of unknown function [Anaplasma phagocytophilum]|nr:Protein of unknown function [Anaplasma phagocytophilum]